MKKICALCFLLLVFACKKDKEEVLPLSAEKDILSFVFTVSNTAYSGTISGTTITVQLPTDTDVTTLTPTISISKGATVTPNSGVAQDFSKEVSYTVTAENKSTKTYKVLVTLQQKPEPQQPPFSKVFVEDKTEDKQGGSTLSISINASIVVDKEKIKVELVNQYEETTVYELEVKSFSSIGELKSQLPSSYKNGLYFLKVTIGEQTQRSYLFYLNNSIPTFYFVSNLSKEDANGDEFNRTLVVPNELFPAQIFVNKKDFPNYKFYLRKNGQDYEIQYTSVWWDKTVLFKMPEKAKFSPVGGKDFQFVMKHQGEEYVFPFLNQSKESIEVLIAQPPVINSVSKTSLKKGEKLVVKGKHFLYNMNYKENCQTVLKLKERYTPDVTILNVEDNNDKIATFIIPDSDNVFEDYPYEITIINDIGQESAPFNQEINIEERVPTSTPLSVIKAVVVKKDVPLYKTVDITFNRMIRDASIKAFVFPKITNSIILYGYRSKMASSITLSDDQYNYLVNELPKGYVLIKENDKEYKAEFSLEKGN